MKSVFTTALFFFTVLVFAQNCLPTGITLSTQTEVNNFPINYPGCVFIQGNLIIGKTGTPTTITDLTPLSQIIGIGGRLIVSNNANLLSLNGLQNITQIQNTSQFYDVAIQLNPSLTNLNNFPAITGNSIYIFNNGISSLTGLNNATAEQILIEQNHNLINLTGICLIDNNCDIKNNNSLNSLLGLQSVGSLSISGNNSLTNLLGLENITSLYSLSLSDCQSLTSLQGLVNLNTITSTMSIRNCDNLSNLDNLTNLTSLSTVSLDDNLNLQNINGLSNITQFSNTPFSRILIYNNQNLVSLDGLNNAISSYLDDIYVVNNPNLTSFNFNGISSFGVIQVVNNPMLTTLSLQNLITIGYLVTINNTNLSNLNGFSTPTGNSNINLSNNASLTDISGLNGVGPEISLNIDNNDNLISLGGLESVNIINDLSLVNNLNLNNLAGLQNVATINGSINISNNNNIQNLNALLNLTSNLQSIVIKNNNLLSNISNLNNLNTTGYFDAIEVENNPILQSLVGVYTVSSPYIENYGTFRIVNNDALSTLSSLDSIINFGEFTITGNANLSECEVWGVCNLIDQCNGGCTLTISNNMAGCNSLMEVETACASVLPITYSIPLEATVKHNSTIITWSVATQINNDKYIIEHSVDGIVFSPIGEIDGDGTNTEESHYKYTHNNPSIGTNYYRIKQIDFDGKYNYSNIASVVYKGDVRKIEIYPNPATEEVTLSVTEVTEVRVVDMMGRMVITQTVTQENNRIDISELPKGIFIVIIGDKVQRFIKQ